MASYRGASTRRSVLISGGGIAGLTLGYWLHHHGLQPTIIEQAPRLCPEGYAIDFGGSGWDVAERMNLLSVLRQGQLTPPYFIFKDRAGQTLARLPTAVFLRAFEGKVIQTMQPDLEAALYQTIRDTVPIRLGTSIQQIEQAPEHSEAFDYTPKAASWLNMIECEFSVISRQCLDRRIATIERLRSEVLALLEERSTKAIKIHWQFGVQAARSKFNAHYIRINSANQKYKET